MSKKLCIFGAGGFAKETYWLARQCGQDVAAFIDIHSGICCDVNVTTVDFFDPNEHMAIVAVGNITLRKKIVEEIISNFGENVFTTLIAPSANIMSHIKIGQGSIICANCVLTGDITIGPWSQLNLATTIGHDTNVGAFFTTAPGVHISGNVTANDLVYFGTNASTTEGISICNDVIIGAGACVTKNIIESGTYVGVPAKKLEKKNV